jgi:putative transposase
VVKPETVVGWHRAGFRLYWRWRSRARGGRPKANAEIRALIGRLAEDNTTWGAPRVQGELLKLGFVVSERTVARYLRPGRRRHDPGQGWRTFTLFEQWRNLSPVNKPVGSITAMARLPAISC